MQNITRDDQDEYCIRSYKRAQDAAAKGLLAKEIVPVTIPGKRGKPDVVVSEDEEIKKVVFEKVKSLNPAFKKDGTGTITAANASTINDGAAAVVLASVAAVKKYDLKPLAKVVAYADAATESIDFPIAPAAAVQKVRIFYSCSLPYYCSRSSRSAKSDKSQTLFTRGRLTSTGTKSMLVPVPLTDATAIFPCCAFCPVACLIAFPVSVSSSLLSLL